MNDSPLSPQEVAKLITDHHWAIEMNPFGMWAVGPQDADGLMNVLGMGRSLLEAFEMAKRSASK